MKIANKKGWYLIFFNKAKFPLFNILYNIPHKSHSFQKSRTWKNNQPINFRCNQDQFRVQEFLSTKYDSMSGCKSKLTIPYLRYLLKNR